MKTFEFAVKTRSKALKEAFNKSKIMTHFEWSTIINLSSFQKTFAMCTESMRTEKKNFDYFDEFKEKNNEKVVKNCLIN